MRCLARLVMICESQKSTMCSTLNCNFEASLNIHLCDGISQQNLENGSVELFPSEFHAL